VQGTRGVIIDWVPMTCVFVCLVIQAWFAILATFCLYGITWLCLKIFVGLGFVFAWTGSHWFILFGLLRCWIVGLHGLDWLMHEWGQLLKLPGSYGCSNFPMMG
jgi:hypothetical protein